MHFPLHDPQFWIVTGAVAVVAGIAVYRLLRAVGARESAPGCASCPAAQVQRVPLEPSARPPEKD